jgi:hypothetical protein
MLFIVVVRDGNGKRIFAVYGPFGSWPSAHAWAWDTYGETKTWEVQPLEFPRSGYASSTPVRD